MKKYKIFAYILIIIIVSASLIFAYTNISKSSDENLKEKTFSEVKYLQYKLEEFLNELNNIEIDNYTIYTIDESVNSTNGQSQSEESETNGNQSESSNSEEEKGSKENQSEENNTLGNDESNSVIYQIKTNSIMQNSGNIDWDYIKEEVELLYQSIPTITLDLYKIENSQEDILNFSTEFDNFIIAVKDEDKQECLDKLTILYEFMPGFLKKTSADKIYKEVIRSKVDIFKAYSLLDTGKWDEIKTNIDDAIQIYSDLLEDIETNDNTSKQYSISKAYIIVNEMKNAINMQDKEIFLIKYKNLLEDINNI
jgi:hypothetical protein